MKRIITSILLVSCFLGCAQTDQTDSIYKDITYYDGPDYNADKHKLNLVLSSDPKSPVLVWLHGGAWAFGDRSTEMELAKKLASQGISVAVVGYRLSPATYVNPPKLTGIQHPEHMKDVARAIRWVYENESEYGYDRDKLFVGGFSAGGHLAALLAVDDQYLKNEGLSKDIIKGSIPISAAFDIANYHRIIEKEYTTDFADQHVNGVFGDASNYADASPITHIDHLTCPMLVISDGAVKMYSEQFEQAVESIAKDIQFQYFDHFSHEQLFNDLSNTEDSKARKLVVEFVKQFSME